MADVTAPKPVPCPLLPGVEPVADKSRVIDGMHWIFVSEAESPCRYIEGPAAPTEAEAITAWNEWMDSIAPPKPPGYIDIDEFYQDDEVKP